MLACQDNEGDPTMAQKVHLLLLCDLHETQHVEAAETALFGVGGSAYDIELYEDHRRSLREAMAPFVAAGRRSGGSAGSTRPARLTAGRPRQDGSASAGSRGPGGMRAGVREWARAHGYAVSDRGRLSAEVLAAYEASQ